mmetsp:Transcript_7797/g.10968  ORF Transcript_7797/g.10968 Transcript_7797/m.10968 type:complete len:469 (+) Transcript_7797:52-1458(+)
MATALGEESARISQSSHPPSPHRNSPPNLPPRCRSPHRIMAEVLNRMDDPMQMDRIAVPSAPAEHIVNNESFEPMVTEDNKGDSAVKRRSSSHSEHRNLSNVEKRPGMENSGGKSKSHSLVEWVKDKLLGKEGTEKISTMQSHTIRNLGPLEIVPETTSEENFLGVIIINQAEKIKVEIGKFKTQIEAQEACLAYAVPLRSNDEEIYCSICTGNFGLVSRRKHHCKNCARAVCSKCSPTTWPCTMLPHTYNLEKIEKKCRICDTCSNKNEEFRAALLKGDEVSALTAYSSGCVNLRSPYVIYDCELPVHCAAEGGSLRLLKWLTEEKCCPLFKDEKISLGNGNKESVLAVAAKKKHIHIMKYLVNTHNCKANEIFERRHLWNVLELILREKSDLADLSESTVQNYSKDSPVIAKPNDFNECIICMESERECAVVPCGHHAFCLKCISMYDECPVCRLTIENIVKTISV